MHTATTDGLRTTEQTIRSPLEMRKDLPMTPEANRTVVESRGRIIETLNFQSERLLVYVGPCSIHDPQSAYELGMEMARLQEEFGDELEIVFRVYAEKPRTNVGWAGLAHDPDMDGSFNMDKGLGLTRELMLKLANSGMPSTTEILDPLSPRYLADLVAAGCIGARTTQSQRHRQLASGASYPVGFKNGTDGGVQDAIDGMKAAAGETAFLGISSEGAVTIERTKGNPDTYIILRGGADGPNYSKDHVDAARSLVSKANLPVRFMIDNSHQNSGKKHENQPIVAADVAKQIGDGDRDIIGVMIEGHFEEGAQKVPYPKPADHIVDPRQSPTDACVSLETTRDMLKMYADAVRIRRRGS